MILPSIFRRYIYLNRLFCFIVLTQGVSVRGSEKNVPLNTPSLYTQGLYNRYDPNDRVIYPNSAVIIPSGRLPFIKNGIKNIKATTEELYDTVTRYSPAPLAWGSLLCATLAPLIMILNDPTNLYLPTLTGLVMLSINGVTLYKGTNDIRELQDTTRFHLRMIKNKYTKDIENQL